MVSPMLSRSFAYPSRPVGLTATPQYVRAVSTPFARRWDLHTPSRVLGDRTNFTPAPTAQAFSHDDSGFFDCDSPQKRDDPNDHQAAELLLGSESRLWIPETRPQASDPPATHTVQTIKTIQCGISTLRAYVTACGMRSMGVSGGSGQSALRGLTSSALYSRLALPCGGMSRSRYSATARRRIMHHACIVA